MSLSYIGQQATIYGGLFLVVAGVIGNGMNVLVFASVRTYRTTPCTFYFLIASIHNIAYIVINLITRIISVGYGIELTRYSLSWCKIRAFFIFTLPLITFSCSCLATVDQFFVTSRSVSHRRLSNIKWAHRMVCIMIIVWCLHGIPCFLYFNISPITNTCINTNAAYLVYVSIYLLGLLCAIPLSIMVIFGCLTYRNIHLIRVLAQQQVDRQMARMTLIQVMLIVVCIMPYGINNTYNLITSGMAKDTNRLIIESFASTLFSLLSYVFYTGSCYMFLIVSSRFRRAIKDRIFFWQRRNQVVPYQSAILGRTTTNKKTEI